MRSISIQQLLYRSQWLALALCALSGRAFAETPKDGANESTDDVKAACLAAFDRAQQSRASSRLTSARQQLLECSRPECGSALMSECSQMYTEVERALPSVVLSARDEARNIDLSAVEVSADGKPLTSMLDGLPISIDPGEYEFVFSAVGLTPVRRRALIGTGEKYRLIEVVFPAGDPAREAPTPAPAVASTPAEPPPAHAVPLMSWVLGGVGAAGLGTFGVLRIIANGDYDTLKDGCAEQGCPDSDINNLEQKYLLSNIALGVGAAAAAGAVLWYVIDTPGAEAASVAISPAPHGDGAVATARGRF